MKKSKTSVTILSILTVATGALAYRHHARPESFPKSPVAGPRGGVPEFFREQARKYSEMPARNESELSAIIAEQKKSLELLSLMERDTSVRSRLARGLGQTPALAEVSRAKSILAAELELSAQKSAYFRLGEEFAGKRVTHGQALATLQTDLVPRLRRLESELGARGAFGLGPSTEAHKSVLLSALTSVNKEIIDHDLQRLCTSYFAIRNQNKDGRGLDRGLAFLRAQFIAHLRAARARHQILAASGATSVPTFGAELDAFESTYLILRTQANAELLERDVRSLTQTTGARTKFLHAKESDIASKYQVETLDGSNDRVPASVSSGIVSDLKKQTDALNVIYLNSAAGLVKLRKSGGRKGWNEGMRRWLQLTQLPLRKSLDNEISKMRRQLASNRTMNSYR